MTTSTENRMLTGSPLQKLSESECWQELATTDVGRLALVAPDGIDIYPVNFLLDGETIVFRSAPGTKLESVDGGADVAFEADGTNPPFRWSVVVRGRARRLDADDEIEASGILAFRPEPPRTMNNFVRITPTRLTGRRFRSDQPAPAPTTVGDPDLVAAVREHLDRSPRLDAYDIHVEVVDGMVTLSGETGSFSERLAARQIALGVAGVRGVRDATACVLDDAWALEDEAVADAVRERVAKLALPRPVEVEVEAHTVRLAGVVPTQAARRAVHHATRLTPGVHFVRDELVVEAGSV
ncbi:pyridoxamine 5'-phosphate oxidase family protein [Pseudolysinimonas sp.]|jgi:osmotically-inducible protein OsmY|uniref:pyridoxamine 5'-phosphate oxidase family protein n=1 Tax=Pseudolysinimonas sp. TaxID=2680009 RepID=UPI003783FF48